MLCRGRGIRSNETPRTPELGQLKEYTGFLVSRSLTLPAAPTDKPQALFDKIPGKQKQKNMLHLRPHRHLTSGKIAAMEPEFVSLAIFAPRT